jgi:hypothetical protein
MLQTVDITRYQMLATISSSTVRKFTAEIC